MSQDVRCAAKIPSLLGEGPLWRSEDKALWWVDCLAPAIHRFDPASGTDKVQSGKLGGTLGSMAFRRGGGLVLALSDGIYLLDNGATSPRKFSDPEPNRPENRFNDGKCDPKGRFWAGTLANNDRDPTGSLYRIDPDGRWTKMDSDFVCPNGMDWSRDGKTYYFVESVSRSIFAYDFDMERGTIANRRVLVRTPDDGSIPDGLVLDTQGYLWVAFWDGWRIVRYAPDGTVDRTIPMPVQRPTSLAFGGANLDRLYITSSAADIPPADLAKGPLAGSLFEFDPGITGLQPERFTG